MMRCTCLDVQSLAASAWLSAVSNGLGSLRMHEVLANAANSEIEPHYSLLHVTRLENVPIHPKILVRGLQMLGKAHRAATQDTRATLEQH